MKTVLLMIGLTYTHVTWLIAGLLYVGASGAGYAQKNSVENGKLNGVLPLDSAGGVRYERTGALPGVTQQALFKRGRKWFVLHYRSAREVLQVSDADAGELIGQGNATLQTRIARVNHECLLSHSLALDVRDGRYRIVCTRLGINDNQIPVAEFKLPYIGTTRNQYTQFYESIDARLRTLIDELEKALQTDDSF